MDLLNQLANLFFLKKIFKDTLFSTLGIIRSIFNSKKYGIKSGYFHRNKIIHFDDSNNKDEWQKEVYEFAFDYYNQNKFTSIIDIGCGSAYKLLKYFQDQQFIGVEVEPTLQNLKKLYPDKVWLNFFEIKDISVDLVICSDVIEHIENPAEFIDFLNRNINFKKIIISTPERDLMHSKLHYGPTKNICHYREWNSKELKNFLASYLIIESHHISNRKQATQVILASKR